MKEYARLFLTFILIYWLKRFGFWSLLTNQAQALCFSFYQHTPMAAYTQALVCGADLPSNSFQSQLLQIGLIHMLVVSGAHLGFLQSHLQKLGLSKKPIWFLLSIYTFLCGAQAPVLRAWMQRWNQMPSRIGRVLWAGCLCVGVFGFSYSLLLSWIATLGVCWPGLRAEWKRSVLIYILMIPALFSLGTQHPLSVIWNLVASAVLGWGLLPISMLAPLHPWLGFISEWAWNLFLGLTQWMAWFTPAWDVQFQISKFWPWLYLFVLQWIALRKEQSYLRQQL